MKPNTRLVLLLGIAAAIFAWALWGNSSFLGGNDALQRNFLTRPGSPAGGRGF